MPSVNLTPKLEDRLSERLSLLVCITYLVDPASSYMLVSKIKPCMSKHKLSNSEAANGSLGHP